MGTPTISILYEFLNNVSLLSLKKKNSDFKEKKNPVPFFVGLKGK